MVCGTIDYMSPEMIKKLPYNDLSDVWALGILLYELLHGYPPFNGKTVKEKFVSIAECNEIIFDKNISKKAKSLINGILKANPAERLTISEIFKHDWMKTYGLKFKINIEEYIWEKPQIVLKKMSTPNLDFSYNQSRITADTDLSFKNELSFHQIFKNKKLFQSLNSINNDQKSHSIILNPIHEVFFSIDNI